MDGGVKTSGFAKVLVLGTIVAAVSILLSILLFIYIATQHSNWSNTQSTRIGVQTTNPSASSASDLHTASWIVRPITGRTSSTIPWKLLTTDGQVADTAGGENAGNLLSIPTKSVVHMEFTVVATEVESPIAAVSMGRVFTGTLVATRGSGDAAGVTFFNSSGTEVAELALTAATTLPDDTATTNTWTATVLSGSAVTGEIFVKVSGEPVSTDQEVQWSGSVRMTINSF